MKSHGIPFFMLELDMHTDLQCPTLLERFLRTRLETLQLVENLSEEDCVVQSMPDASPAKWHLAHTTWFFETFILEKFEKDFQAFDPRFRIIFNSYYNGVGEQHPRAHRGVLTRPNLKEVFSYRHAVDEKIQVLLKKSDSKELQDLIELGIQHEQQHQELILTDLLHLFSLNPVMPSYRISRSASTHEVKPLEFHSFDSDLVQIGFQGNGFAFDNERPQHRQFVEAFQIANRLVTSNEYLAFVEAGGYQDSSFWLAEGWAWIQAHQISKPFYWRQFPEVGWKEFGLEGLRPLDLHSPVRHLTFFEADAFARWSGARLPTEAEWEVAARKFSQNPHSQYFGEAWQWTSSSYSPYPGFAPAVGAVGEYNGKFMVNQYVLKGSSLATPIGHSRISYRNFFPATAQWQFTGIRLARS